MEETLEEIVTHKSFDSLVRAVDTEKEKKAGLQQTILKYVAWLLTIINGCWEFFNLIGRCQLKKIVIVVKIYREEESRRLVKTLQRQLLEVKKEKESEIQVCKNFSFNYFTNCYLQTYLSDYLHVQYTLFSWIFLWLWQEEFFLKISCSLNWWSISLFSWPLHLIQGWLTVRRN